MYQERIKLTQAILATIAKIDEFKGLWHGSIKLNPQVLNRLKSSVIITSSGASTRIEGSKMNDEEVGRLLRGLKSKLPKGRDEQEVAGYADLLGRIFDNYKTFTLSENRILQFHEILLKFSEKDEQHRGKYKSSDNVVATKNEKGEQVILFRPTPPYLVKAEMLNVISWADTELKKGALHPLLIIANFIFEFLAIHPFKDGNGRLSRALTNLLLLRTGYAYVPYVSLEEIIEEQKIDYYLALRATQKNHKTEHEDITPWINYLLKVLLEQTARARKLMDNDQPEKLLSEKQLRVLNLFDQYETLSVAEIHKLLKNEIPRPTIKQSLYRLLKTNLLQKIGQTRSTRYKKSGS